MKRAISFAVLMLTVFFVSGCTAPQEEAAVPAPAHIKNSQSLIIQLVSWYPLHIRNKDTLLVQKIERFREEHPNV
ncbi:LptM family lipoprotein [Paenibacillus harenae]|uniref:ABC transporter substrate-binding protein n=1 Tax=Paenibacillus harenae TaxID=306543 RepID=A0ABT9U776_PAEHA|nr:hypothetical protein [Paenibacillus harenae]MDQ0115501.1 hypothetical protein [Paenibacillus harenae]